MTGNLFRIDTIRSHGGFLTSVAYPDSLRNSKKYNWNGKTDHVFFGTISHFSHAQSK
ncbi:MAG: hypothetical protein LWX56_02940 [Ignavibacteria bacterium]|nr:hypothetical protein [Ignavibacteria bacterium]